MREMYYFSQPIELMNSKEALEVMFKMMNAVSQLLCSSDYPHWDLDFRSTIYDIPFLDETAKRNILSGSAQKLFKLDPVMSEWKIEANKKG